MNWHRSSEPRGITEMQKAKMLSELVLGNSASAIDVDDED